MTTKTENKSYKVLSDDLVRKIKELLHEGNIRKLLIKDEKGKTTYLEIPVTIGVIGVVLIPVLAAVGALAAMVGVVTLEVIKETDDASKTTKKPRQRGVSSKKQK